MLKPNDEYRDAVEVLELALAMGEGAGAGGGRKLSPQKLTDARRVRESLDVLQPPNRETFLELGRKECFMVWEGRGCSNVMHGRSRMIIDPRVPTMPRRSTSGFYGSGRRCLHQARSAVRCWTSRMEGGLHPTKSRF